jgi:hypothetical protein
VTIQGAQNEGLADMARALEMKNQRCVLGLDCGA